MGKKLRGGVLPYVPTQQVQSFTLLMLVLTGILSVLFWTDAIKFQTPQEKQAAAISTTVITLMFMVYGLYIATASGC